mgnify:CR=1 FL=1
MNKKGFTLIELLSTIAIMTIIATVLTVNVLNIFESKQKITNQTKENIITTAANVYLELNKNKELKENCKLNGCNISVNTLIKEGLLNEEDVNNSKVINIYYENNEQKVKIS